MYDLVHDLPQLYTKPSAHSLFEALQLLRKANATFNAVSNHENPASPAILVDSSGVPRYLTSIIASPLSWLPEHEREEIWEAASVRLSERSGRTAQPSMIRSFQVSHNLTLNLHEPSLTEDSLGLKTWTSSWLLAKRLHSLSCHVPSGRPRVLELGAGTGLVGLAAASIWQGLVSEVMLTDLPEIVPNLRKNIDLNFDSLTAGIEIDSRILDWSDDADSPTSSEEAYPLILAADPIYSMDHPPMLVAALSRWLQGSPTSRFILELPLRQGYDKERQDLRMRLEEFMVVVEEGRDLGHDDWEAADGQAAEVECWWSVWRLKEPI